LELTRKSGQWQACEKEPKKCLSRHLPDERTLTTEIMAWEGARNIKKANIRWNFTVEDARVVFKDRYPASLPC
jgi:hypothetical protein